MENTENKAPNISITQVGKYFSGSRKAKENILRSRKNPKANKFLCNRYNSIKSATIRYMIDENHNAAIFEKTRKKLLEKPSNSEWNFNDKKNSLQAVDILQNNLDKFFKPFIKFQSRRCSVSEKSVKLFLVEIGLNPEIILVDKTSEKIIGVIKLIFTKEYISKQTGEIITTVIRDHLIQLYKDNIVFNNCVVIDVFGKKVYCAPTGDIHRYYKRILKSTFLEIVEIWDKL